MILQYGINHVYHSAPLGFLHKAEGNLEVSALDASLVTSDPSSADKCTKILVTDEPASGTYVTSMYIDNIRYLVLEQ